MERLNKWLGERFGDEAAQELDRVSEVVGALVRFLVFALVGAVLVVPLGIWKGIRKIIKN